MPGTPDTTPAGTEPVPQRDGRDAANVIDFETCRRARTLRTLLPTPTPAACVSTHGTGDVDPWSFDWDACS